MFTFILMIGFSIYLAAYGFVALFKQEWLMKVRAFSARIEGKGDLKHEDLIESVGQARKIMAVLALVFGVIGVIMSIMVLVIAIQASSGTIAV